jgi:ribosome-associated translation inhibitor RaiA
MDILYYPNKTIQKLEITIRFCTESLQIQQHEHTIYNAMSAIDDAIDSA